MLAFLLIIKFWRHSNAQARNREAIQYLLFFLFLSQKHPFYPSSDSTQQSGRFARTVQHQHTAEWQICAHNTASIHSRVAGLHARTVCVACHSHVHQRTHTVCAPKSTHCMCTKEHTLYVQPVILMCTKEHSISLIHSDLNTHRLNPCHTTSHAAHGKPRRGHTHA